jgi:hypothetical protein
MFYNMVLSDVKITPVDSFKGSLIKENKFRGVLTIPPFVHIAKFMLRLKKPIQFNS